MNETLIRKLSKLTPDSNPNYREIGFGRWTLGGRVFPVKRPERGQLVMLPPKENK